MGGPPPHDPYGQAPQPGPEPYPGYASMHDDYYRRHQQAAAEAEAWQQANPQASANPLRNLGNWGLPQAKLGLSPQDQQLYDTTRKKMQFRILHLIAFLGFLLLLGILGLVRTFT